MVWCSSCGKNISRPDNVEGKICCSLCGRVLDEDNFSQEPTFVKNAAGQSRFAGNFVKTIQNDYSVSRERILNDARDGIDNMIVSLGIDGGDFIARPAIAFYTIALERGFTRGRRKEQVEASCLYISCRDKNKPYLLIDFSEYLRINVYVLGAVFLQLCKLLSLEEHPIIQKLVDPSLFIHRFTDRLFGGRKPGVSKTALQIIASMKRDWMQTGRKPSGLCGAALYISALSHGLKCTKSDVMKVVHVCEATLTKRLIEFENTESGGLTVLFNVDHGFYPSTKAVNNLDRPRSLSSPLRDRSPLLGAVSGKSATPTGKTKIDEFNMKADEVEKEERLITSRNTVTEASGINELLCVHKGSEKSPFAHGLCKNCYEDFIKLSGGLNGGSEPPAFQRAEMERIMAQEAADQRSKNSNSSDLPGQTDRIKRDELRKINKTIEGEVLESAKPDITGATKQHKIMNNSSKDRNDEDDATFEESESYSDIDDKEVDSYLHSKEEKEFKKIIWEMNNKEYLEEQAAKEAAAIAAKEALRASCSGDVEAAQRLAAAAAEAVAKSRKEKRQKRAEELKNAGPAQTAHEATKQVLDRKRLSSKVNLDALKKLLEPENPLDTKKRRIEPEVDHDENYSGNSKNDHVIDDDYPDNSKNDHEIDDDWDGYNDDDMHAENVEEFNYDDDNNDVYDWF